MVAHRASHCVEQLLGRKREGRPEAPEEAVMREPTLAAYNPRVQRVAMPVPRRLSALGSVGEGRRDAPQPLSRRYTALLSAASRLRPPP